MPPEPFKLGARTVGEGQPPLIVAEMSGNHNQSLDRALELVDAAADSGADAVKLQTYTADTMTLDIDKADFYIDDPGSLWKGKTLYQLYEEAHTLWDWHEPIIERCRKRDIEWFSTPFDDTAVEFLEQFDPPAYKIASFENIDLPLIRKVASTGKPVIISTGMASLEEIGEAVQTARDSGCRDLVLLHCVSSYPAPANEYHLKTIADLAERFAVHAGLSDHTLGTAVALAATSLGACVIEKHFTLKRSDGGPDAAFSLEPGELKQLCEGCHTAWQALGRVNYDRAPCEERNVKFRRSIYVVRDINPGEAITADNIKTIRPGYGLPPKHWDSVLGKKAREKIDRGTPLQWSLLEP
ncbi:MAG: pseudaminic acid synthase [Candidatus Nitronauta litoralis]|uniref:Pseudaminic acid synthase n=1 Tax=Candidatus Nitronauta litoralis TaxID=2705533 RepID=A0A7T0BWJ1_9BACT|nr:MAG: pseudaminic acid synthase [Candidatus Nitronauta litoralis]